MSEKLFKKKYSPKNIEEVILLPRLKKKVDIGITDNIILYGSYGMGKTVVSDLLIKGHPFLKLNASKDTSIEVLRTKLDEFCSKMSMFDSPNKMKYVFLDEIERLSSQYQDALKGFIEDNQSRVRFIATTNHIEKVNKGVLSRFTKLNFNPVSSEEVKYLKKEYAKRLKFISDKEEIGLEIKDIAEIVNKNFPDMREMVATLQYIKETGEKVMDTSYFQNIIKDELFKHILSDASFLDTYNFIDKNFGEDKIIDLIILLGRPFVEHATIKDNKLIDKMQDILEIVTKYNDMLANSLDPVVLGVSLVGEVKKIVNK